jgi:ABC-type glycerol-3-phosphate transport system substrate-binding protein
MKRSVTVVILMLLAILQICPTASAVEEPLKMVAPVELQKNISLLADAYKAKTGKVIEVEYIENRDDYSSKMSTEILAGSGPDIFLAGSIPYWDYAKKGMLVDVGELIEKDPNGYRSLSGEYYRSSPR